MKNLLSKELKESDIFSHLTFVGYMPRWVVLAIDLLICLVAYGISIAIGKGIFDYDTDWMREVGNQIWLQIVLFLCIQTVSFWAFHTYSGILRFSTFVDTIKVMLAVLLCTILMFVVNLLCNGVWERHLFLNTAIAIYLFTAIVLLCSWRIGVKTLFESLRSRAGHSKRVLIYGTKAAGVAIAKMLKSSPDNPYRPVGFISDQTHRYSYDLLGMKVILSDEHMIEKMQKMDIHDVIVSPLKMKEINPSKVLPRFLENNIHVLTTPDFTEWEQVSEQNAATRIGKINSIQIEDLLERPTIDINTDNVRQIIEGKVLMVTGAAGSIGSELVRQIIHYQPSALILLEQAESPLHDLTMELKHRFPAQRIIPCIGDVRNRERVEEVVSQLRPDVIYHAAAYKHVPLMEDHPNESIQANVGGTRNLADMAVKYKVERFVMISTDKAVNPTNIMGASKRIAEIYVQSLFKKLEKDDANCTKFITTRFGNVLGSNGSVIPYFKKQIAEGGPVTVTHPDIIRYFMTIPEACTLVLEASTLGNGGEIFVFDMGHPVKILDLAKNMIRLAGYTPDVDIHITFTGLRPGEKLYEELLNQKETTLPTSNEKIMIAKVREFEFDDVEKDVEQLIALSHQGKPFMTVAQMKKIVPEFKSKNSVYEQLDK